VREGEALNELKKLIVGLYLRMIFGVLRLFLSLIKHQKLQADILKRSSNFLADAMQAFDSRHSIVIANPADDKAQVFTSNGKIMLSNKGTDRYLKQTGRGSFEGDELIEALAFFGIKSPRIIVDVGANFGEISLCFSAEFPKAKIIAIEPSSANVEIFNENLTVQNFDTSNITLHKTAVSDEAGDVQITKGLGSQNSIVAKRNMSADRYESVRAMRLDDLFEVDKIKKCDFLKIDIEGAEPYLKNSLAKVLDKTQVLLIEFSYKNTPESYASLVAVFESSDTKWKCYDATDLQTAIPLSGVIKHFTTGGKSKKPLNNFWFIKQ